MYYIKKLIDGETVFSEVGSLTVTSACGKRAVLEDMDSGEERTVMYNALPAYKVYGVYNGTVWLPRPYELAGVGLTVFRECLGFMDNRELDYKVCYEGGKCICYTPLHLTHLCKDLFYDDSIGFYTGADILSIAGVSDCSEVIIVDAGDMGFLLDVDRERFSRYITKRAMLGRV